MFVGFRMPPNEFRYANISAMFVALEISICPNKLVTLMKRIALDKSNMLFAGEKGLIFITLECKHEFLKRKAIYFTVSRPSTTSRQLMSIHSLACSHSKLNLRHSVLTLSMTLLL